MKNLISSLLLLIMCSTAVVEASSPPVLTLAVSDHQVVSPYQQKLFTPVVLENTIIEMPVIPYLTGESAVAYSVSKAVLNDMRHYYAELDNSTKASYKELAPNRQLKYDYINVEEELNSAISTVGSRAKRVTFRIRQL